MPDPEDLREQARTLLDPYLDPFWQILQNKVRTASELAAAETQLVWARSLELTERPIGGRYDLTHLRALHRHLFQTGHGCSGSLGRVWATHDLKVLDAALIDHVSGELAHLVEIRDRVDVVADAGGDRCVVR